MGVTIHHQVYIPLLQQLFHTWRPPSRITADMSHKNLDPLAAEFENFRKLARHSPMIHITADGSDGTYILKTFRDGYVTYVSGMPYLVAFGEILSIPVIPVAVGVAQYANSFHLGNVPG